MLNFILNYLKLLVIDIWVNYNSLPRGLKKCRKLPPIFINGYDTPSLKILIYIANNLK